MTQASAHAAAWMLAALALTTADECLGLDREFAQAQGRSDFARYPLAVDLPATPGSGKRGLALAQGDVDGDGMPDLVLSLVTAEGEGKLLVYPGNVDYLFPHTAQARARQALSGAPPEAFLAAWPERHIPVAADRMVLVDSDADGRMEVIVGAVGGDSLWRLTAAELRGSGDAQSIALEGTLTALAAGEVGRRDGVDEVVAAITHDGKASLLLWAGSRRPPTRLALPAPVSALAVGMLNEDPWGDVVWLGAERLGWISGSDRTLSGQEWAMPQSVVAPLMAAPRQLLLYPPSVARGARRGWLLDASGTLHSLEWNAQGLTIAAAAYRRADGLPWPATTAVLGRVSTEALPSLIAGHADGHVEFGLERDSATRLQASNGAAPVAMLAMRLNADALDDLVIVDTGSAIPSVVASAPQASFLVENNSNLPDCAQGDGVCSTDIGMGCGSGGCSLRAALQEAAALPGPDAVNFSIAGGGQSIINSGELVVNAGTSVDATTQPGYAGVPLILLFGNATNGPGLATFGANNLVRGMLVRDYASGIAVCGSGDVIEANITGPYPGTAPANGGNGVGINIGGCNFTQPDQSRIGGTVTAARNYAYGNGFADFAIAATSGCSSSASNTEVLGNYFGFEPDGSVTRTAWYSANICQFNGGSIGGIASGSRNLLAGAAAGSGDPSAMRISDCCFAAGNLLVLGNRFGAAADGSPTGAVGQGIRQLGRVDALSIGAPGGGNELVGFPGDALLLGGVMSSTSVQGNWVGQLADGSVLANGGSGIYIDHLSNSLPATTPTLSIGGSAAGEGNVIAHQAGAGVLLRGGERSRVRGNSIHGNGGMAIDIQCQDFPGCGSGPTLNDPGDPDGCGHNCANAGQNHPVVTLGGGIFARGTLNSRPASTYTIDLYAAPACPPDGRGDLTLYLGSTVTGTTDANGDVSWSGVIAEVPQGWVLTATATDEAGNTSEPAPCRSSVAGQLLSDGFED